MRPSRAEAGAVRAQVLTHDINFGVGPAGTGKTYLAVVACAVDALERDQIRRILLVRPAVEAGERLGFLPGDLAQKIDPTCARCTTRCTRCWGSNAAQADRAQRDRGRTAGVYAWADAQRGNSFIILDEAQNTTTEQMKMFLTRLGFGSTVVITGDITQIDLPRGQKSGLREATEILREVDGISFTVLQRPRRGAAFAGAEGRQRLRAAATMNRGDSVLDVEVQLQPPPTISRRRQQSPAWARAALGPRTDAG